MNETYYLDGKAYSFSTQEELSSWLAQNPGASKTNDKVSFDPVLEFNKIENTETTTPVVPPLSSNDFYYKAYNKEIEQKPTKQRFNQGFNISGKGDFNITSQPKISEEDRKEQPGYIQDKHVLENWLNTNYFDKGMHNEVTRGNIVAYQAGERDLGELKKHFKKDLGQLNISRNAYPNLTDSDLDKIFEDVFDQQIRLRKKNESVKDEYIKINDILSKKEKDQTDQEAIASGIDKLDNATINSNPNKLEARFAQLMKSFRAGDMLVKDNLDPNIPGSVADLLFNKDETKLVDGILTLTGKRIPKDKEYKMFHDPKTGLNIKVGVTEKMPAGDGQTLIDFSDSYAVYLHSFKNTSQANLRKYNERVLLEEAGYNLENEEVGDYYVGDKTIQGVLREKGYKSDAKGIFKNVKLSDLVPLSHVPGMSNFWSRNVFMSKGDIIPQNYKDKPYKNPEEFIDFLVERRKQNVDIISKKSALWDVWYLNRDPETINKGRFGQVYGSFMTSMFGEDITVEQSQSKFKVPIPLSNQKNIDIIASQIIPESNVEVSQQQLDYVQDRTFTDELFETSGSLGAMLLTLSPVNKVQKVLGINRLLASFTLPKYVKNGKSITQGQAIKLAAKQNKNLDDWAKETGYVLTKPTSWDKGKGIIAGGIVEDIKMREVLGAVNENMQFERGVGFGFFVTPRFLPYGFGRFGKGKPFTYSFKRNQMNTFMQSTFINAPAFALAVEGGDALGAVVKDLQGKQEVSTWVDKHWSDYDVNLRRIGLNLITGKMLGMMHFNHLDFKTTAGIGRFQRRSTELIGEQYDIIKKKAESENTSPEQWQENNPNSKEVKKLNKHWEDFNLASERLFSINETAELVDPSKAKETYDAMYEPLKKMFEAKGKELKIVLTDKPIYQEVIQENGKIIKQEVSALYTRMGGGKVGTIQINTKKSKGRDIINHEGLHAYLDMMFDGNPSFKLKFESSFRAAVKSIKTPGSNLYQDIMKTKGIEKDLKLEEMMAYTAEYLSKAEYYTTMVNSEAFIKIKSFWNNFTNSTFGKGKNADLTTKQDIIDILGSYGKTGDFKKLERLNEIIEFDPTGKAGQKQLASKENINKTVEKIKSRKAEVLEEIKDLRTAQGNTNKFKEKIEQKTELYNELNSNQKKLENQLEIKTADPSKEGWQNQVDKNYTVGKHKNKAEFDNSVEKSKITNDILNSKGLENMIRQAATKVGVAESKKADFVSDTKDKIIERFIKNYDPGKINAEFGRALTPFEYLTTGQAKGTSIVYRAAGDVMVEFKKTVETTSYDVFEQGAEAFTSDYGYSKSVNGTGSKVEQQGIVVSEALNLPKSIEQKVANDIKNLDFETQQATKKVSYKNIGKNSKIIEKDIVVDYYGVSAEIYKKMQKSAAQQLNNADIEAIQNVIKNNLETHIKLLPRGLQVIIDPFTGENVAQKTVSGVPSEAKATGTTTVLLRNPLLYKEIKQTGTKGSKYEYSDRLKEYHKSIDPVFKKKFEQEVLESWGMGETQLSKAQLSGIYKGIMTQTRKAVYVQGVAKNLPETPQLKIKISLANMINQISAGKAPTLAKTEINELIKLIQKQNINLGDIKTIAAKIPKAKEGLIVVEQILMERQGWSTDVDVVKLNERLEAEASGTSKELDLQESVNRAQQIAKELKLNQNLSSPTYISENPGAKITITKNGKKVETTVDAWRNDMDAQVIQRFLENSGHTIESLDALMPVVLGKEFRRSRQKSHKGIESIVIELGLASSQSRKYITIDGKKAYINKGNKTISQHLKDFYGQSFENLKAIEGNKKYDKVYRPDWSTEKKNQDKLELELKDKSIDEIGKAKVEAYRKAGSYSGKSKDYEATEKANKEFFEDFLTAKAEIAYQNKSNFGLEYLLQSRAMQTNHGKGASKSFGYGVKSINAKGSELGTMETTSAKGVTKTKKVDSSNHWEHDLQLLNQTNRIMDLMKKHKGVTSAWKKGLSDILDVSNQHLIPKRGQLFNDAKGPTTFTEAYKQMLKKGIDNPLLNVFANEYARLENQFVVSGPNKGKSLLDVQLESIDLKIAKKIVQTVPKNKWSILEYQLNNKVKNEKSVKQQNVNMLQNALGKKMTKELASKEINEAIKNVNKALENGRKRNKVSRGASVFDFDETVAFSENFVYAKKGKETKKISSAKWPEVGDKLLADGWKMDFTDFNKVTKGKPGPLMQKLKNQIKKFGPENVFILTARAKESQKAIHDYLKSEGVNIPIENITGLGKSTGEAKALWMLEKFAEGYNDMYFVDDAISNVEAVRSVLNQLDIKSKVQQVLASTEINKTTNEILEHSLGIDAKKTFTKAEAKIRGKGITRRKFFMSDSASDLELLIEPLYGKGKKGIENKEWFKKEFIAPFERGIRDYNTARQSAQNDYMALRKQNKDVVKIISKEVEGTSFTNDMAMRVYLWNKAGFKIPDLAKTTEAKLVNHVKNNPALQSYAETFAKITRQKTGLKEPSANWWGETMAGEITNVDRGVNRKQYLQEYIDVKNEIFSELNLNKMESKLGTNWRENLEDIFDRMETGRTRSLTLDRGSNLMMDYLNGSVGTIMNFNTRSAMLQTISTINFLNMKENNPIAAARAMGNVPQFAKDFLYIMNSDMLKQRRGGLEINVSEAELASAARNSKNPIHSMIAKVLKVGYTPTKLADSFAISFGGATFYRNRIKMYEKQGMETKAAEKQAFLDFQSLSERTQQSSRPDLLSRQQTTLIGRVILPFANTPMQMNRRGMKDILDLSKGRFKNNIEAAEKMGRITYYMGAQVALFAGLQSAFYAMLFNDENVTEDQIARAKGFTLGTVTDSFLSGFGIQGRIVAQFKNATLEFFKQNAKPPFKADYEEVAEDLLNISPLVGPKYSTLDKAGDRLKYGRNTPFKFELGNPKLEAGLMTIQSLTNAAVYSPYQNANNIKHGLNSDYETWQRFHMFLGFDPYSVGIETKKKSQKVRKFENVPTIK